MEFARIGPDSLVFDVGGFQGNWASEIYDRYGSRIHIFEPHPNFIKQLRQRFDGNNAFIIHGFALGLTEGTLTLTDDGDASSSFRNAKRVVTGRIEPVERFFENAAISDIDLMKINIEGGEYDLIPALVEGGVMPRIGILQVQFHLFSADDIQRRDQIRNMLAKTHSCDWSYDFVWEQWSRRTQVAVGLRAEGPASVTSHENRAG